MRRAIAIGALLTSAGAHGQAVNTRQVGGWTIRFSKDAMTDKKSCTARQGLAQTRVEADGSVEFLVDFREIGNLAFTQFRFDDDQPIDAVWDSSDDNVGILPSAQQTRLQAAKRLRARGINTGARALDADIPLGDLKQVTAVLSSAECQN